MKLERGFQKIVNACAEDTDTFLLLIMQMSEYMRVNSLTMLPFLRFPTLQHIHALTTQEN